MYSRFYRNVLAMHYEIETAVGTICHTSCSDSLTLLSAGNQHMLQRLGPVHAPRGCNAEIRLTNTHVMISKQRSVVTLTCADARDDQDPAAQHAISDRLHRSH